MDQVGAPGEPQQRRERTCVAWPGLAVGLDRVQADIGAFQSRPRQRPARAGHVELEPIARQRQRELDYVAGDTAVQRLRSEEEPPAWFHGPKGIVRSPRTGQAQPVSGV
jgi:hypothetical protein